MFKTYSLSDVNFDLGIYLIVTQLFLLFSMMNRLFLILEWKFQRTVEISFWFEKYFG